MVVPLPPSKSQTKPYKPVCNDSNVICNHCVNHSSLLNKKQIANTETYRTYTDNRCDLTNESVYRCGCSSGIKSATVRDSTSAPRTFYTQEIFLMGLEIIFRYIILGTSQQLHLLRTQTLRHTGVTSEGPPGPPGPGLTLHCDTVRIHFAVVNVYRRG